MKRIFYTAFVIVIFTLVTTTSRSKNEIDGITFFKGTWQDALQKSAAEKKLIFLDISTSWCGWCKKMRQTTYFDKKVGVFFNAHFINVELDGENGEGQRLARKYGVTGYPSLYIVDKNENQILSSEGYHDPDDLIKLIRTALKEK